MEGIRYYKESKCACGCGKVSLVLNELEVDDYGRTHTTTHYQIECPNCCNTHHIEEQNSYSAWGWDHYAYLVPNGLSINHRPTVHLPLLDFEKTIAAEYSKDMLIDAVSDMKMNKYSTRVTMIESKLIISEYKKHYRRYRLSEIIPFINNIIDKYDTYEWPYDKYCEIVDKVKENQKYTEFLNNDALLKSELLKFVTVGKQCYEMRYLPINNP